MKSKIYIKEELKKIYQSIDNIFIKYEFRRSISTHIVEITPLTIFESDKNYINLEIDLEENFQKLFPEEEIIFVSNDSLITVNNSEFEFTGWLLEYNSTPPYQQSNIEVNPIIKSKINYSFAA